MTSTAPKTEVMFLPPSHPFWKMTDDEFEHHAGVHVRREVVKLIPAEPGTSIWKRA
jgi:hypothetical protein